MADKPVKVEIVADSSSYKKTLKEAQDATASFAQKTKGHGKEIAAAGAVAAAGIGAFAASAIDAASDYNETVSKSKVIFGDASASVISFAENAAESFGLSQQAALDAEATFATFGKGAGLAGQDLSAFAQDLTGLAADMASFSNTSPEQAIEAIGAALRGEAEPIRAYGVLLDDATLKAAAMKLGIYDGTGALTQQQKVLAAQKAIFDQTSDSQGDFARTSDGLAGKQKILSAQIQNTKIALGEGLIPVAIKAFEVLQKLAFGSDAPAKDFKKLADSAHKNVGYIVNDFDDLINATKKSRSWLDQGLHGWGNFFSQVRHPFEGSDIENVRNFDKAFSDLLKNDPDTAKELVVALHELRDASDLGVESAQSWVDGYDLTIDKLKELDDMVGLVGDSTAGITANLEAQAAATSETERETGKLTGAMGHLRDTEQEAKDKAVSYADQVDKTSHDVQADIDAMSAKWDALRGQLDQDKSWINIQQQVRDVRTAIEEAGNVTAKKGPGSPEAIAANEDAQLKLIDLKNSVIDYGEQIIGLPPEKVTELLAEIDQQNFDSVLADMDRQLLTRKFRVNAHLDTIVIDGETHAAGSTTLSGIKVRPDAIDGARAGGGPVEAGQLYVVGENGEELFVPEQDGQIINARQTGQIRRGSKKAHALPVVVPQPGDQRYVPPPSGEQMPGGYPELLPGPQPGDQAYVAPAAARGGASDFDSGFSSGGGGGGDTYTITGPITIYMQPGSTPDDMMQSLAQYVKRNGPGSMQKLVGI